MPFPFDQLLLTTYWMPGTVLGPEDTQRAPRARNKNIALRIWGEGHFFRGLVVVLWALESWKGRDSVADPPVEDGEGRVVF